jgi:hypothetical protein
MGKKDLCDRELKDIQKRQEKHAPDGWQPLEVCDLCTLHRWITSELVNDVGELLPAVVTDSRLSVYAECNSCAFGKFSLRNAVQGDIDKGLEVIGSVRLPASYFIGKWHIKHDPFPFERKGEAVDQHPNHVQIICTKEIDVFYDLSPLAWYVSPGKEFPHHQTAEQRQSIRTPLISVILILLVSLLGLYSCIRPQWH